MGDGEVLLPVDQQVALDILHLDKTVVATIEDSIDHRFHGRDVVIDDEGGNR